MDNELDALERQPVADGASQSALIKALSTQIWMAAAVVLSGVWSASDNRWGWVMAGVWIIVAGCFYKIGKSEGT